MNETRNAPPTPEQLVKLLELQLSATRGKCAEDTSPRRVMLLAGGLLFIVAACGAALLILQTMLSDLRERGASRTSRSSEPAGEMKNFGEVKRPGTSPAN